MTNDATPKYINSDSTLRSAKGQSTIVSQRFSSSVSSSRESKSRTNANHFLTRSSLWTNPLPLFPFNNKQCGEYSYSTTATRTSPMISSTITTLSDNAYEAVLPIVSPSSGLIISIDWIAYSPIYLGHSIFENDKIGSFISSDSRLVRNMGDTIIAINGEGVRGKSLSEVMIALSKCGEFARLRFKENPSLINKSQQVVQQRVQAFDSALQALYFKPESYKELLRLLLCSLRYNNSVKHAMEAIRMGLLNHPYLVKQFSSFLPKSLDFSFTSCLSSKEITALAHTLKYSTHVERLKISCQSVGPMQIFQIAEMLEHNHTLIEIDLGLNNLGDYGAKLISRALEKNHSLQVLVVRCNNFGLEGIKSMAQMIKRNCGLKGLNLAFNNIANKEAAIIADSLRDNSTLISLNICDINIDRDGYLALRKCMYDDTSLNTLSDSNHTLTCIETLTNNGDVKDDINELLALNSLGPKKARKTKRVRYLEKHFRSTLLSPDLSYKYFPYILALMGDLSCTSMVFELLSAFPDLFHKATADYCARNGRKRTFEDEH